MKLAFNSKAHYTDFAPGYELYKQRMRGESCLNEKEYKRVIKRYCSLLADELLENGIVDLPCEIGSIAAAVITRKAQYRGNKFIGYGAYDYKAGHYDGKLKTFGLVFLPKRGKHKNFRCYGFVGNRSLFKRMKEKYAGYYCPWRPIEFKDEII